MDANLIWIGLWFGLGLMAFYIPLKITDLKSILAIGSLIFALNLWIKLEAFPTTKVIEEIMVSIASSSAYLIGANLSRSIKMGVPLNMDKIIGNFLIVYLMYLTLP